MDSVVILAKGDFPQHPIPLRILNEVDTIICCDGAVNNLVEYGLIPTHIIGDMDSITNELKIKYEDQLIHIPDQNENDLRKAMRWAEKAITSSKSGEAYGQRGNVYYKSFQECRSTDISIDDRIIASLAYQSFKLAEENDYRRFHNSLLWLEENEVLFGRSQWFMLDANKKKQGYIKPDTECYKWVEKKLEKDTSW